jgi:peptidoglycan/LPS O-acetylase OafA/YrhL
VTAELASGRSTGLDALRAIACLMVVVFHSHTVGGVSYGPLNPVISGGDIGVWVFFVLSGYLLYRPFLVRDVDLRSYALKRAARILPGYYVALIGLLLITGSRLPFENPLAYLTISASYDLDLRGFLGPAWTLAAEVIFYVTLPFIARIARGRELAVLGALGAASIGLSVVQRYTATEATLWLNDFYPMVFHAFVPGMLLAVMEVKHPAAFAQLDRIPLLVAGIALIVAGMLTSVLPIDIGPLVGAPLVIAWLLHHRIMGARALVFVGGASYALYLWHYDLFRAFGPAGLLIALMGSVFSWLIVERPILYWAHRRARLWRPPEPSLAAAEAAP